MPRTSHAAFEPRPDRDPIAILESQEADRLQDLVPLRHGRMAASAFALYRGTPAVMAFDLATTPRSDILVRASGDAHLSNFGIYASPERHIVFDASDFDETLLAPWEWDASASRPAWSRPDGPTASARRPTAPPRWRRCAPTASGWPPSPGCAWSRSGTSVPIR